MPIQQMFLGTGAVATKTYIDDIFSNDLWTGDGSAIIINNGLTFATGLNLPLGTYIQGGYFQGTFTDNSVEYALIVAPNGTGNNSGNLFSYGSSSASSGATSLTDGPGNTSTLAAASGDWAAGDWAAGLSLNGYSDWYLPAKDELTLLYQNRSSLPSGQEWATSWDTWSSTEIDSTYAWMIYMNSGTWSNSDNKTKTRHVRAIRRVTVASLSDYQVTGQGGMVWIKQRNGSNDHVLFDTVRGAEKALNTNTSSAETTLSNGLTDFLPYGFKINSDARTGASTDTYAGWNFRKAPGFFDIVTYTGNGSNRTIAHSLGCVPGSIWIKQKNGSGEWICYHRSVGAEKFLQVNNSEAENDDATVFQDTEPTASVFSLGTHAYVNSNTDTYVAYLFAGGESTAATARSVAFSSTGSSDGDSLTIASSSDTDLGSGDFTLECWFKDNAGDSSHDTIFALENYGEGGNDSGPGNSFNCYAYNLGIKIFDRSSGSFSTKTNVNNTFGKGQWTHFAWTRSGSGSNNNTIWINGRSVDKFTGTLSYTDGQDFFIGSNDYSRTGTPNGFGFNGNISNVRITKGQAIYTTAFKPSTTPMTTTTGGATASNVEVICCNNSSITGSSVTSGTITSTNTPTASTDSPFDDPAGFKFGDAGDQNVIKCGSYVGNGDSDGPEIDLGWEPTFLIVKNINDTEGWVMFDQMRGMNAGGDDKALFPNQNTVEQNRSSGQYWPTPTGFKLDGSSDGKVNGNDKKYIFLAVRISDGYCGKPAEAGTDVFAMDTGNSSSTIPCFDSNFAVDFALITKPATTLSNYVAARLFSGKELITDGTGAEGTAGNNTFDSNAGWRKGGADSTFQSWMWKRNAGMDVVAYGNGTSASRQVPHSLSKIPEMIWVKKRDSVEDWAVYHKGLNGGSSPEDYYVNLNSTSAEVDASSRWDDTAPTATHFTVGTSASVNGTNGEYLAMLFASTDVSKVGFWVGDGTNNRQITTGFQPRFLIVFLTNQGGGYDWQVYDSTRGFISPNNNILKLNTNAAQSNQGTSFTPNSTGFTITEGAFNGSSQNWIYYAHA